MKLSKVGLVLEGGGFRGLYTSGVLDYFMEHGLYIPDVYGVSAGACNAISYTAKQPGRNAEINFQFCKDPRYLSYRNLFKVRGIFNMQFAFETIPEQYIPFDYDTFYHSEIHPRIGATNLLTGKCDFFGKEDMDDKMYPVRASAAIPMFSHTYYINGVPYLDGGTSNPIPIRKSINDGHQKNIIILTQDPSYTKPPQSNMRLIRRMYRDYPAFINTLERRHLLYNRQRKVCAVLAKAKQAIVLQPRDPVRVKSMGGTEDQLRELYRWGYEDAERHFEQICQFVHSDAIDLAE